MKQEKKDIIAFLKENVAPLNDVTLGAGYRASAYLLDGTYLPCVIFRNPRAIVNLAIKRFKEEMVGGSIFSRKPKSNYYNLVKGFVATGNCVNEYDIQRVEKSRHAFPIDFQMQIKGETTMGWTGFSAKMKDGKYLGFGTNFRWEFFQMPDEYSVDDITEIINHSYVLKSGELVSHRETQMTRPENYAEAVVHREMPFFECFIDDL
ncbi:hypothetical protein ACFQZS_14720 [Mucilaginibacter calamicampi]|uniref:Uncharacterized protein n=1 Tax=Mucilaginibacter calamicampi TaxID=1302352 RepID=A0ABW2YZA7_9SPHI